MKKSFLIALCILMALPVLVAAAPAGKLDQGTTQMDGGKTPGGESLRGVRVGRGRDKVCTGGLGITAWVPLPCADASVLDACESFADDCEGAAIDASRACRGKRVCDGSCTEVEDLTPVGDSACLVNCGSFYEGTCVKVTAADPE